ncbi:hypothetical protein [Sphingobacterium sp. 1.A.5]|uniref:hypothetical protein n=1 Tax=Sphingobacterium sp. 1.A.5 TaxID=2044604 RepID=UPI000C0BFA68|nr:hypothetical protein [Sphingobacterium sp. 1.A.5]
MKQIITERITLPRDLFFDIEGTSHLQERINLRVKDLREKYSRVEYLDHKLEEGYLDTSVDAEFVFSAVFEVG